ncbi:MAG: type VII toxin-antitoxin system HepT family RNase toxin [Promethearchaeota archaeon]
MKRRKISRLLRNLEYLRKIREMSVETFLGDYGTILATLHAVQESSQVVIDLAFHICAHNKLHEPTTYREVFKILASNGLLEESVAAKLERWAGLRNLIAHAYGNVDEERLFNIVIEDLADFDLFMRAVEDLEEEGEE